MLVIAIKSVFASHLMKYIVEVWENNPELIKHVSGWEQVVMLYELIQTEADLK